MSRRGGGSAGGFSTRGGASGSSSAKQDVQLSKLLSYILRHGAHKQGVPISPEGFVDVEVLLGFPDFRAYTVADVRRAVTSSDKQRFALEERITDDNPVARLYIRANQGHTIEVEALELSPITASEDAPIVVHGTYDAAWDLIKSQGLSRMKRNHIHFAVGLPGASGVISGMRSDVTVLIYLDVARALADGIPFFRSSNNVILSPGLENGSIPAKYFSQVRRCKNGVAGASLL
ncbi:tRNA phosphotransferase 1 [Capsaspora owczarzaki ATCC 30864]|uniref:2'-phosphotransferase n=1 Tax=Capsaspora owczarzaki (strain ATCC 30864) TaxID=595528 RepID=A0A0D2VPX9_CAPO3|nr:tRNA phosphotransferase 1 [Capsaspora owczarzaki ATCC 30864]KJE92577.1 tRNA phosphotransferase 1, variant 1 [Capsaspora owczarzaki ATCC 30864]|eukprot:XP_004348423.2 tRNA phosphotransferase 1 [Capsaspora owczarzaki ATCC 30864]